MVAKRQAEYNETYTQITVTKNTINEVQCNILLKPISCVSNYVVIAELTFT